MKNFNTKEVRAEFNEKLNVLSRHSSTRAGIKIKKGYTNWI